MTKPGALLPVTTGPDIQGYKITRVLGVVRGIVVRSPGFKRGVVGSFKSLFSGNIKEFEDVCEQARAEAYGRMVAHANLVDADAIVAMRYDATDFAQGVTEVLAYGTAVKLAPA